MELDPKWDEHFHFPFSDPDASIKIMIWDAVQDTKMLGSVTIPVKSLVPDMTLDSWHSIAASSADEKKCSSIPGRIRLSLTLHVRKASHSKTLKAILESVGAEQEMEQKEEVLVDPFARSVKKTEEEILIEKVEQKLMAYRTEQLIRSIESGQHVMKCSVDDSRFQVALKVLKKKLAVAKSRKDIGVANLLHHTLVRLCRNVCQTKYAILFYDYCRVRELLETDCVRMFNALHNYFDERMTVIQGERSKIEKRLDRWQKLQMDALYVQRNQRLEDWKSEPLFKHMIEESTENAVQQALFNHQSVNSPASSPNAKAEMDPHLAMICASQPGFKEELHRRQQEWTIRLYEIFRGREEILLRIQAAARRDLDRELTSDAEQVRYERRVAESELIKHYEIRMLKLQKVGSMKMLEIDHWMQIYIGEQPSKWVPPNSFDSVNTLAPMLQRRFGLFSEAVTEGQQSFLSMSCAPSALSSMYSVSALEKSEGSSSSWGPEILASDEKEETASVRSSSTLATASADNPDNLMSFMRANGDSANRSLLTLIPVFESMNMTAGLEDCLKSADGTSTAQPSGDCFAFELMKKHCRTSKSKLLRAADLKLKSSTAVADYSADSACELFHEKNPNSPDSLVPYMEIVWADTDVKDSSSRLYDKTSSSVTGSLTNPREKLLQMAGIAVRNPLKKQCLNMQLLMVMDGIEHDVFRHFLEMMQSAPSSSSPNGSALCDPSSTADSVTESITSSSGISSAGDVPTGLIADAPQMPGRFLINRFPTPDTSLLRPDFLPAALSGVRRLAFEFSGVSNEQSGEKQVLNHTVEETNLLLASKGLRSHTRAASVAELYAERSASTDLEQQMKQRASPEKNRIPRRQLKVDSLSYKYMVSKKGEAFKDATAVNIKEEMRQRAAQASVDNKKLLQDRARVRKEFEENEKQAMKERELQQKRAQEFLLIAQRQREIEERLRGLHTSSAGTTGSKGQRVTTNAAAVSKDTKTARKPRFVPVDE
eukprot:ANDGO_04998.mRNA.1 hypothetical protein